MPNLDTPLLSQTCRIPLTQEEMASCNVVQPPKMGDITWRIFRIMAEFVEGFQFLSTSKNEITILGSARFPETHRWYQEAKKLGALLAEGGFTVITGGGPGIMEGANRGAFEAGGESIGINIQLPTEQRINPYVKDSRGFSYFFTRKVMLTASAQAYVFFPGGFGTLDEFFEILTLVQTGKAQQVPMVCVGKDFWEPVQRMTEKMLSEEYQTISPEDPKLFHIVDTVEEAYELVKDSKDRSFF